MIVKTYEYILQHEEDFIIVDVRTSSEFSKQTIPGAINIPLFTNDEYQDIGKIYKSIGKRAAVLKGIEYTENKLKDLYLSFYELYGHKKKIAIFCSRGGMRSTSVVNFISNFSISVVKIDGGYKAYRRHVLDNLPALFESKNFISIYGSTGSGKTRILHELRNQGYNILDLEGCANHRGSLLGDVGLKKQNSQKMFESLVYDTLRKTTSNTVYTEGESRRIGFVVMPQYMYDKLSDSRKVIVETTLKNRVNNILEDYVLKNNDEEIIIALRRFEKYLSKDKVESYILQVMKGDYESVIIDLIENYYDKRYKYAERFEKKIFFKTINECVEELLRK